MKRQQSDLTSRVYAFGSVPARIAPVRNEESGIFQLRLGRRLWNTLTAIDRVRMERYKSIMRDENQERVEVLKAEIEGIREAMRDVRKKARKKTVDLGDMPERLKALKTEGATILEHLRSTASSRHAARKTQLDENSSTAFRRIKRARQAAGSMGLFWGSYNDIVQRADSARKLGELQFRGFRGDGTLTAQIIGGTPASVCLSGTHTFFQIDGPTAGQKWRYARIRIGSNADRSPVWLEIPIVYHREIPADAQIKSVSATRRIVAGKVRWQVNVTVTMPRPQQKHGDRAIAVDIGWRLLPDGVRVAYWHDGEFSGQLRSLAWRIQRKTGELQFRGFRGDGTLTAQIIGGTPASVCLSGTHTFFQIDGPTAGQKWRYARIRIGSNTDRSPVWLEIPIVYHREIPADAQIKSVSATRRIVAGKVRWQVNVTVTMPRPQQKQGTRAIAVDIGWRLLPDGVRVAYWHDGERNGQVLVRMSDIEQFRKVESLRSICDRTREESIPMLSAWLDAQSLPDEWRARSAHLIQWRSGDRLANLIRWWADNRLEGDTEIFEAAVAWRKQYLHTANWWRNLSEQMTLRLREQYRIFAAHVAREYDVLVIEDFDLREVAAKQPTESMEPRTESATYRQMVSPSTFRAALANTCAREGVRIVELPAAGTTSRCWIDGAEIDTDQAESVTVRYRCGHSADQDDNAARSLFNLYRASGEAEKKEQA